MTAAPLFLGVDLALNHSGLVMLREDGRMIWHQYVHDKKTQIKEHGVYLDIPGANKIADKQQFNMLRLMWWRAHLQKTIAWCNPSHFAVEDYAINAKGNSAYQIGELGGLARTIALDAGCKIRLHDPMSVKMWAAHIGNAGPEVVAHAVKERWPVTAQWDALADFPRVDLCVAYAVAEMLRTEYLLRAGKLRMEDQHEQEIRVWNRVTKTYPVSLLSRDWLTA